MESTPVISSTASSYWNVTATTPHIDEPHNYLEQHIANYINLIYIPICAAFGVVGNGMSFCVLVFTSMRKTTTCLYMASIALMDTIILIMNFIYYLRDYVLDFKFQNWSCGLIWFIFFTTIHYDVLLLLAMTVERYIAIRYPLKASSIITTKKTTIIIVCTGMFSVALNMYNLFTRHAVWSDSKNKMVCSSQGDLNIFFMTKVHPWIDSTFYCFIPMTSLFLLNILIACSLKQASKRQQSMRNRTSRDSDGHRQVTIMLMLVSFAFLFLSGPIAVTLIAERYAWVRTTALEKARHSLIRAVVNNLMYTNHMVNFLLYCISGRKFRLQLRHFIFRRQASLKGYASNNTSNASVRGSIESVYDTCVTAVSVLSESQAYHNDR